MKPNEPDEPGSAEYNSRLWRRTRNEKIIAENQPLKEKAGASAWQRVQGSLNNSSQPTRLRFHQFENHLAVADDRDSIWSVIFAFSCAPSHYSFTFVAFFFPLGFSIFLH